LQHFYDFNSKTQINKKQLINLKPNKMKTLFFAIVCSLSVTVYAGGEKTSIAHPDKYCAKMKDGKLVVMHQENEMTSATTLTNGVQIQPDGTVTKTDGSKVMLKTGECVDKDGKIMEENAKKKKMK